MNQLDYLVENGQDKERVVIKTGVPRETALKLEANKLYLPGVELEDGVLIRRYPGGEAMSHILGYVGKVSQRDLGDKGEKDELGYPIYDQSSSIGKDGLELTSNPTLRGKRGRRIVEMDASGATWRVVPDSTIEPGSRPEPVAHDRPRAAAGRRARSCAPESPTRTPIAMPSRPSIRLAG